VHCGYFGLSNEKNREKLKFDLGDHLSEERFQRNPILSRLLNGDIGFFMKLNSGKKFHVFIVFLQLQFVLLIFSLSSLAIDLHYILSSCSKS
jgi:hypothetical protein